MKTRCEIKQRIPQQLKEEMEELQDLGVSCNEINYIVSIRTRKI